MADTVRYLMEEMVPELEDMQRKRYFSREEIKEIVRRRTEFEYKLKRKAALKEDFLSYAEYETKLDQLRQARRRGLGLANAKQTLADYALVKRVHFIFERAARKFKRDLDVWTRWLAFCRATRSNRRLSRVAARALQLIPNAPGLWAYAAAWELEENGNAGAARALMQAGLRACRDSADMWLQYLDMELMYAAKLRARREALGLPVPGEGGQEGQQQQQEEDANNGDGGGGGAAGEDGEGPAAEGEGGGGGGGSGSILASLQEAGAAGEEQPGGSKQQAGGGGAPEGDAAVAAVLKGAVAAIVARRAAAALPGDLELRRRMLGVLGRYSFPGVAEIVEGVYKGLAQDFGQEPIAVDLLARRHCNPADAAADGSAVTTAVHVYEGAVAAAAQAAAEAAAAVDRAAEEEGGQEVAFGQRIGGAEAARVARERAARESRERLARLWQLYCAFLKQRADTALAAAGAAAAGGGGGAAAKRAREAAVAAAAGAAQQLLAALQRAHAGGGAGEEVYEMWADAALQLRQKKVALRAAKLACEAHPSSPDVWRRRIDLEARLRSGSSGDAGSAAAAAAVAPLLAALKQALQHVPAHAAPGMWIAVTDACRGRPGELRQMGELLLTSRLGAAKGPAAGGLGAAAGGVLRALWEDAGPEAARQLYSRLAALPPAGGDVFRAMLALEGAALEDGGAEEGAGTSGRDDGGEGAAPAAKRRKAGGASSSSGGGKGGGAAEQARGRVRRVLEAAVDAYGAEDASLWLALARFEQRHAARGAGQVYWRAVKALADPEPFIQEFRASVSADV